MGYILKGKEINSKKQFYISLSVVSVKERGSRILSGKDMDGQIKVGDCARRAACPTVDVDFVTFSTRLNFTIMNQY